MSPGYLTFLSHPTVTGVKSHNVDLEKQTAEVTTVDDSLSFDTVLATIRKTGKTVNSAEADGVAKQI